MGGTCHSAEHFCDNMTQKSSQVNPFYLPHTSQSQKQWILKTYSFISNYEDKFLGRCSLVQSLQTQDLYLSKDIFCKNQTQLKSTETALKSKQFNQSNVPSLLKIKQVFSKLGDGLFGNFHSVTLLIQYPLISLKKELHNRQLNQIDFSTSQIANILHQSIKGYAALQRQGCINDKIRLAHIFLVSQQKENHIKVIDSQMLPSPSNFTNLKNSISHPQNHDIYLAPEEFQALMAGVGAPQINRAKAGVFSLGASILQLCIMLDSRDFYEFHLKKINSTQVASKMKIAKKKHGSIIYQFLTDMLQFDVVKRPTFTQLEQKITRPMSEAASIPLSFSTLRDDKQKYVLNDPTTVGQNKILMSNSSVFFSKASQAHNRTFTANIPNSNKQILQNVHWHYPNNASYIGNQKNQQRHGDGRYAFKDGSSYEGQWKFGYMTGHGRLYFPNGELQYQGEWLNDDFEGWGVLNAKESQRSWERYEGEFSNGNMHGRGKLFLRDLSTFEGQFQNGKILGFGRKVFINGIVIDKYWPVTSIEQLYLAQ